MGATQDREVAEGGLRKEQARREKGTLTSADPETKKERGVSRF